MKILVTGADGFIAKNLVEHLKRDSDFVLYLYTKKDSKDMLDAYVKEVDFIFHLAGVNRPENVNEFYEGNSDLTKNIVDVLKKENKKTPILFSSSTQVTFENDYAKSKLEAENILLEYSQSNQVSVFIYRLPNVFGKWCKPNYNSVIATWCYNITHGIEITVNDEKTVLDLVYIDDVVESFIQMLSLKPEDKFLKIKTIYSKSLGEIKNTLYSFKNSRETLLIPEVGSGFKRALYATYLSYFSSDNFSYALKGHQDERGTFYEVIKTQTSGQVSISTTAPGVTRGGHFHHTKNEKFLVVKGEAVIEFRHILTNELISYKVSDKKMKIVEMIPGYSHNIKNTGDEEMILFIWANECYDDNNSDTYYLEV